MLSEVVACGQTEYHMNATVYFGQGNQALTQYSKQRLKSSSVYLVAHAKNGIPCPSIDVQGS